MSQKRKQRVVIVGAGFAGVHTYLQLHKRLHGTGRIAITMINPTDYFVFTPLIHEVATGGLLPDDVTQSLRTLPRCCIDRFVPGHATEVDCAKKYVRVRHAGKPGNPDVPGDDLENIEYDYLVLAMGSETNFFDVPGAEKHTLPLKDVSHARRVKNHVLERFQHAQTLDDLEALKKELRFIVVGGGPTGVEIAGELSDFVSDIVSRSYKELEPHVQIVLIERGQQLLKQGVHPWFSKRATDILSHKKSVHILYGTSVSAVKTDGVQTNTGFLASGTVIWAAGVVARTIAFQEGEHGVVCENRSCRIRVNEYLQIPEHKDIFVVGDQAWVRDKEQGQPYPMRAQFAVREGECVGDNIVHMMDKKSLISFSFKEKGLIISLGEGGALARIYGFRFSGPLAWFVYRTVYLLSMIGWRTRLRTAFEWTLNLFLPRDISKI